MAQNIESTVNIKATADTSQAVSAMDSLWKSYSKINDITLSLNKNASNLDDKSILKMRESYIQLAEILNAYNQYGLISEKQTETFGNAFNKSWMAFNEVLEQSNKNLGNIVQREEILQAISNGGGIKPLSGYQESKKLAEEQNKEIEKRQEYYRNLNNETERQIKLQEEINKVQSESTQDRWARIINTEGTSSLDPSIAKNINNGLDLNDIQEQNNQLDISSKLLDTFANKLGISTTELKALGEALGFSAGELLGYAGAATVAVAGLKLLVDNTKEMITTFKNVGSSIGEFAVDSIDWFVDSLQNMVDVAEQAIQTLDNLAEAGTNIESAFLTTSAYIGKDATDEINNFIQSISGASNTMFASINDVVAAAGSMGLASDQLVEATENMTVMGRNLGVLIGDTQKAFRDLGQTISKGYVGRDSILYRIFTKQEIEQVRQLGDEVQRYNFILERSGRVQELYNEYIQTASGKVSLLKLQYQELMNNIGLVALNLYAMVAPVLTKILTIANQLLSVLISVFGWEPKSVGFTSIASDIGNSLDNVAESAGKANKQLASFDDVIQINDNKSGGIADVGDIGGLQDFGDLLGDLIDDSNDLEDIWAHFKELLDAGDWFGAGKEFMQVITDQLRKINWDDIQSKAKETGKAVAEFLNGIFMVDLDGLLNWRFVGKTIAEALNTIIIAVGSFLKEFDFKMMGKALGQAWDSLWDNLDIDGAAEALYEAFMGAFELVNGWLTGGGLTRAAEGIAQFIRSFFGDFKIEDTDEIVDEIVNAIVGVINDIINALSTVAEALTSDDVKKVVFTIITKLVNAFRENGAEWGKNIHDIIANIMDFIIEGINTADKAGIKGAFMQFITNLNLSDLLTKYLQIKWALFKEKVSINITTFFSSIGIFLQKGAQSMGQIMWAFLLLIMSYIALAISSIIGACVGFGERIANWLRDGTAKLGQTIGEFLGNIIGSIIAFIISIPTIIYQLGENIVSAVTSIGVGIKREFEFSVESIKLIFSTLWDFVMSIFDPNTWGNLGRNAIDALWQGIKNIWNNTIGSWSFDIPGFDVMGKQWDGIHFSMPKLATGGIVTSATTALIGEAGKEAVLPLENNTQWMDKLATKLANQINGGNRQNGGTVRLELSDKPFYTRAEMYEFGALIVESLKAYGLNIAIV